MTLKMDKRNFITHKDAKPENHLDLAWASVYLANAYEALKRYSHAKKILEKSLSVHNELLGENNIRSAWVLFHLGGVNIKLGNYSNAKSLLKKALMSYEKDYGKEHIETARILEKLGQAYLAEHNLDEAEDYLHKALKIVQMNGHTDSYIILEDLAQVNLEKSRLAETQGDIKNSQNYVTQAADFLNQALNVVKASFLENSPHLKRIQLKLQAGPR